MLNNKELYFFSFCDNKCYSLLRKHTNKFLICFLSSCTFNGRSILLLSCHFCQRKVEVMLFFMYCVLNNFFFFQENYDTII